MAVVVSCAAHALIEGNGVVESSGKLDVHDATIKGNILVGKGSALTTCGMTLYGGLISVGAGLVTLGSPICDLDTVTGNTTIADTFRPVVISHLNQPTGSLTVSGNHSGADVAVVPTQH